MKVVIINQARMTSTRLPGKILKEVLGKPLLEYQIERLRRVKLADELVIATTTNETDQPIIDLCHRLGIAYYRGAEDDVLSRYYEAAQKFGAEVVVRVTSDCPLIDPAVIDKVIKFLLNYRGQYDYVSNILERTYPRGMDTEVFFIKALETAYYSAANPADREHVTLYIYSHAQEFRIANVPYIRNEQRYRWTVDTPEDFQLVRLMIESLYSQNQAFTLEDCLQLMQEQPGLHKVNKHIEQKTC